MPTILMEEIEVIKTVASRIKTQLKSVSAVSVAETLISFREDQQVLDPNFELRITDTLIEKVASTVLYDKKYYRDSTGKATVISLDPTYKPKKWHEKSTVAYDLFKGLVTAIFSLAVGWLLLQSRYQAQDQKYKELKLQLDQATYKIDSLTKSQPRSKKISDSLGALDLKDSIH